MSDTVEAVGDIAGLGDAVENGAGVVDVGRWHDRGEEGLDGHVELKYEGRIPIGRRLVQGSLTEKYALGTEEGECWRERDGPDAVTECPLPVGRDELGLG